MQYDFINIINFHCRYTIWLINNCIIIMIEKIHVHKDTSQNSLRHQFTSHRGAFIQTINISTMNTSLYFHSNNKVQPNIRSIYETSFNQSTSMSNEDTLKEFEFSLWNSIGWTCAWQENENVLNNIFTDRNYFNRF